ncbi:MAG: trigger factor family protein, partial [Desulfarculus sp.]|nr:trigger factor family protein [Pseudomonadota bacterium]MBV1751022.1 trigger factor family protein [Desulfarculus sp.]
MKVNVEELSQVQRRITVELPAKEVDKTLNKIYNKL